MASRWGGPAVVLANGGTADVTKLYDSLREQILAEPLNVGRTDQEVLDWENDSVEYARDLTYTDFAIWMIQDGISAKLDAAVYQETEYRAANPPSNPGDPPDTFWTQPVWNGILSTRVLLAAGADIALGKSEIRSMINTISGSDLPLTNADRTSLFALSDVTGIRWFTQLQYGPMDDASKLVHIAEART